MPGEENSKALTPVDFAGLLRDKIKKEMIELIPQAQFDKLVQAEIEKFLNKGLPELIRDMLREDIKKRLSAYFISDGWEQEWNKGVSKWGPGEQVRKLVKENIPQIIEAVIGGAFNDMMISFRNNMARF